MNLDYYKNGQYDAQINELRNSTDGDPFLQLYWIMQSQLKGNRSAEAVYTGLQMLEEMLFAKSQEEQMKYYQAVMSNQLIHTGIRVMREVPQIEKRFYEGPLLDIPEIEKCLSQFDWKDFAKQKVMVFPVVWPVAFGDTIVMLQFMKYFKEKHYHKIIAIYPQNRPDLKELFTLCPWVDQAIDITLMEAEQNRNSSLALIHPSGYLNVSIQEFIVKALLEKIGPTAKVMKLRYLPFLFGKEMGYTYGQRIWEERARMWLENKEELPKIVDSFRSSTSKKITVHFREGKYGDTEARDINPNYSQDLINELKIAYPEYEIVRLGDSSMTLLQNCRNASHENLSVEEQIQEIQTSQLFIGCHSAPQMLAVATSNTPVICICYTAQETTSTMEDSIPRLSYEPLGQQVKKIFYQTMRDKDGNLLIPSQNNPDRASVEYPDIQEILQSVKEILG